MSKIIREKLADNVILVANFNEHTEALGTELYVYLTNNDGMVLQDLGIFRNAPEQDPTNYPRKYKGIIEALIYGQKGNEDWTDKFDIEVWEESEE